MAKSSESFFQAFRARHRLVGPEVQSDAKVNDFLGPVAERVQELERTLGIVKPEVEGVKDGGE